MKMPARISHLLAWEPGRWGRSVTGWGGGKRWSGAAGLALLVCAVGCGAETAREPDRVEDLPGAAGGAWNEVASLPAAVSNNAVASALIVGRPYVFSFSGMDSTRRYSGISDRSFAYDVWEDEWSEFSGPGTGRIAATAQTVHGRVYLFGGYTVAADGSETTLASVDILDPISRVWSRGAAIPTPVDDAVSGVWRDSLVYLISGWHDRDNVRNVQVYDPVNDRWQQATPIPGPGVFGHAGGIVGDRIVYADGVRTSAAAPRFRISGAAFLGTIDPQNPTRIAWEPLPAHPGSPLYRMAAVAFGPRVIFAGGTANPYNYDGIGYDGSASAPVRRVFAYNVDSGGWESWPEKPLASMDHRGLAVVGNRLHLVGGMLLDQRVTQRVQVLEVKIP